MIDGLVGGDSAIPMDNNAREGTSKLRHPRLLIICRNLPYSAKCGGGNLSQLGVHFSCGRMVAYLGH